jgi:hypothetical protein
VETVQKIALFGYIIFVADNLAIKEAARFAPSRADSRRGAGELIA